MESWTSDLGSDTGPVHMNFFLTCNKIDTKFVESWIPGFEMDSGVCKSLVTFTLKRKLWNPKLFLILEGALVYRSPVLSLSSNSTEILESWIFDFQLDSGLYITHNSCRGLHASYQAI